VSAGVASVIKGIMRKKIRSLATPYYFIDEKRLLSNLKVIESIRNSSGAKVVLALKCFSTWCVFDLMRKYLDGTTASSPNEARLGTEKFGKEVHVYSVGFSLEDIEEIAPLSDTVIFNSLAQLKAFHRVVRNHRVGIRINPQVSYSAYDLADPARKYSRLGVVDKESLVKALPMISGALFHFNCDNDDFQDFSSNLDHISHRYKDVLRHLEWVSLGGGIYFTKEGYPVEKFCRKIRSFAERFGLRVYLEPGESTITRSTELVTRVLDIVRNKIDIAIVDASTEAHMLDLLIYRTSGKMLNANTGNYSYMVAGRSCLAGDVFGTYRFSAPLKVGSSIRFTDAAGYTMVKKNWFNGLKMPSIVVKRLNGSVELVRQFTYKDFKSSLS